MRRLDPHTLLSALWLFILLNIIFRDIHQFVLASHLEMLLTGYYNGIEITEGLMLRVGSSSRSRLRWFLFSLLLTRRSVALSPSLPRSSQRGRCFRQPPLTWMTPSTSSSSSRPLWRSCGPHGGGPSTSIFQVR